MLMFQTSLGLYNLCLLNLNLGLLSSCACVHNRLSCIPEAVHVEDMPAGQLLVSGGELHFLAANDADIVAPSQVGFRGVWESLVHVGCHLAVSQEV